MDADTDADAFQTVDSSFHISHLESSFPLHADAQAATLRHPLECPPPKFEAPDSDSFVQMLEDSLQELHRKLLFEYQRTRQTHGSGDDISEVSLPLSTNIFGASPKENESSKDGASAQPVDKAKERLSLASGTQKSQASRHGSHVTASPQNDNEDLPKPSPSGVTSARNSTLHEVFLVHAIFKTNEKEGQKKKGVVQKRAINPNPTLMMRTMDTGTLSNIEYLDRSCFDRLDRFVCTQTSPPRVLWDVLGALLVLLDVIEIPIQLSFQLPDSSARRGMAWLQRIFWTIDCISLFFTSYTTQKGTVVRRMRRVTVHYASTWFPIDAFVLFFDWFDFVGKQVGVFSIFQGIRVLRLVRLLRAAHIAAHMPEVIDSAFASKEHSEGLKLLASTVKMMFGAALLLHVIACLWHWIGTRSLLDDAGWLYVHVHARSLDASALHLYLVSYHWSITQLIGSADIYPHGSFERAFAILVLFLAFVISASVVSSITTSMTAIQFITSRKQKQLDRLRHYLVCHNIPSAIAHRVLQNATYALEETHRNVQENEVELLGMISEPLYIELHHAMYKDFLGWHPFFSCYMEANNHAVRQVCHVCLTQTMVHGGDVLFSFSEQKQKPQMYFLLLGKMLYAKPRKAPSKMVETEWASEHVLWTKWTHMGGLRAEEPSNILCVDSYIFQNTANQFRSSAFWPAVYAQGFVALLNETEPDELTDLEERWTIDVWSLAKSIFHPEDDTHKSNGRHTTRKSMWGFFGASHARNTKQKLSRRLSAQSQAGGPQSKASLRALEVGEQARGSLVSQRASMKSGRSSNLSVFSNLNIFRSTSQSDAVECPPLRNPSATEYSSEGCHMDGNTSRESKGTDPIAIINSVMPTPPGLLDVENLELEDTT